MPCLPRQLGLGGERGGEFPLDRLDREQFFLIAFPVRMSDFVEELLNIPAHGIGVAVRVVDLELGQGSGHFLESAVTNLQFDQG